MSSSDIPLPALGIERDLAGLLRPELPALAEEIMTEIRRTVPEFTRPAHGRLTDGIRLVERELHQFVDRIEDPHAPRERAAQLYRALGRGEYLQGRSLDALQTAYRIAARLAWRRIGAVAGGDAIPPQQMFLLAEAIFTYVEEISAHSIAAYTELSTRSLSTLHRRRRRLLELLTSDSPVTGADSIAHLARDLHWRLPDRVACLALDDRWRTGNLLPPALDPDVLTDLERPDPYMLLPDPDGPGRIDAVRRALHGVNFALGPSVPPAEAALSLRIARQVHGLMARGLIPGQGCVRCEDHLATLLLLNDEDLTRLLLRRHLAKFADLRLEPFQRLAETLYTWLTTGGSATEVALRLHLHPQTVRYRMRRLESLFGEDLHDPQWRFTMQLALQADRLLSAKTQSQDHHPRQDRHHRSRPDGHRPPSPTDR